MRESVKLWVAALRSGKYRQGKGFLTKDGKDCCLGVACQVYQEEVGGLDVQPDQYGSIAYNGNYTGLPRVVQEWLGLQQPEGMFKQAGKVSHLTHCNDELGYTFDQIADVIEMEPKGLFVEDTI